MVTVAHLVEKIIAQKPFLQEALSKGIVNNAALAEELLPEIEKELKKQALINKADNIHFVGFVSDIDKVALLSLGYAVLFPSHLRSEAFGVTLLEGAMYYKPLISSEIGTGTSYINVNGSTGIIIQPGSADSLREAMDYLWNNPKIAAEMGKNAGERYERLFTADIMARSYYDVYRKLSEY